MKPSEEISEIMVDQKYGRDFGGSKIRANRDIDIMPTIITDWNRNFVATIERSLLCCPKDGKIYLQMT